MKGLIEFLRNLFRLGGGPGPAPAPVDAPAPVVEPLPDPAPRGPSDTLVSYEKLPPGARRPPAVFVTDPIPRAAPVPEQDDVPVPGGPWEAEEPQDVVIRPDGAERAQEMSVQNRLSAYRGSEEDFVPVTEDEMLWESEEEHESGDDAEAKPPVSDQMAFDFGQPQQEGRQ